MGENLNIFYSLDEKEKDTSKATDDLTTLSGNSARGPQTSYMPCKATVVTEGNEIYIPISQAQDLCREIGEPSEISKVYLKKMCIRDSHFAFADFAICAMQICHVLVLLIKILRILSGSPESFRFPVRS